jgi:glycosyltransferase involved in cell wall biosynthesis
MNIYFVCSIELGLNSGASLLAAQYTKNLAELGNDVTLFAPQYGYGEMIEGVNIIRIPCGSSLYTSKIIYQILLPFVLAYRIMSKRPDCLLVKHNIVSLGFVLPAQILKIPFVLQVDAEPIEEIRLDSRYIPSVYLTSFERFQRYIFAKAAKLIVVHPAVKRGLVNKYDLKQDKIEVIKNGVDIELFEPLNQKQSRLMLNLDSSLRYLTFVGHVLPWHGVEYIIQAILHLKEFRDDFKVIIVGDGPSLRDVMELANECGVGDKVDFIGEVPREQVPHWISASDICLLPAKMVRSHPGDPIKMYEYMACGKPIIAANVEGYGDFVEKNRLGISVDFTDSKQLAAAMDSLLKEDLSFYRENNRRVAVSNHQWSHTVERVNEVLNHEVLRSAV